MQISATRQSGGDQRIYVPAVKSMDAGLEVGAKPTGPGQYRVKSMLLGLKRCSGLVHTNGHSLFIADEYLIEIRSCYAVLAKHQDHTNLVAGVESHSSPKPETSDHL